MVMIAVGALWFFSGCSGIGPQTESRDRFDDRDLMSKKIFSFLMFVFTLVETGEKGTVLIVKVLTN